MNMLNMNTKPFVCEICNKAFTVKPSLIMLTVHYPVHTGERPVQCEVCFGNLFNSPGLHKHMKIHTGEKNYHCEICLKSFALRCRLKEHLQCHTAKKTFNCYLYDKMYFIPKSFTLQFTSHFETADKKLHECKKCGKVLSSIYALRDHARIHSQERPFQCMVCSKQLRTSNERSKHKLTHSRIKPFTCQIRKKQFARKRDLQSHTHTHSTERMFKCSLCAKGFAQYEYLQRHMKSHQKEDKTSPLADQNAKPYKCDQFWKHVFSKNLQSEGTFL